MPPPEAATVSVKLPFSDTVVVADGWVPIEGRSTMAPLLDEELLLLELEDELEDELLLDEPEPPPELLAPEELLLELDEELDEELLLEDEEELLDELDPPEDEEELDDEELLAAGASTTREAPLLFAEPAPLYTITL